MAVMAMFEDGPLDGEWKSMGDKEALLEIRVEGAVYRRQEEMPLVSRHHQAHYRFVRWAGEGGTKKGKGVLY